MIRFFQRLRARLFDRTPPIQPISAREQRNREIDKAIAANRQHTRRERVLVKREAQKSTRYYNAMTEAMELMREPA